MLSWNDFIVKQSSALKNIRQRRAKIGGSSARYLTTPTQQMLNFVSNDYLGLTTHSQLIAAFNQAVTQYGVGSSGAPSLSGYSTVHQLLAEELADWLGYESCLLFNSGYQLNVGIFQALCGTHTKVWFDRRCHASHIDGILLAKAKFSTFNSQNIEQMYAKIASQNTQGKLDLVLSEGTFSMDGSCDYWHKLFALKQLMPEQVLLVIDDAHGVGALGKNGFGSLEQFGLAHNSVDLFIGTLGKAFGSHGGFICGKKELIYYLQHSVRSQIFSTNLPPAVAAASRAGLALIKTSEGEQLRQRLRENIIFWQRLAKQYGINLYCGGQNQSPIQLVVYDNSEQVNLLHEYLCANNILVGKIIYPTVPKTSPRLRISLNALHQQEDLERLAEALAEVGRKL